MKAARSTSSGHSAIEAIARQAGLKYKHVTYDGGNPAVVSTVSGETDATTQLLNLTGALGVAWVCWRKRTWQPFWLEALAAAVALVALARSLAG